MQFRLILPLYSGMASSLGSAGLLVAGAAAGAAAFGSLYASGVLGTEADYKELYLQEKRAQRNATALRKGHAAQSEPASQQAFVSSGQLPNTASNSSAVTEADQLRYGQTSDEPSETAILRRQLEHSETARRASEAQAAAVATQAARRCEALAANLSSTAQAAQALSVAKAGLQTPFTDDTSAATIATLERKLDAEKTGRIRVERRLADLVQRHETLLALAAEGGLQLPPNSGMASAEDTYAAESAAAAATGGIPAQSRRGGSLAPVAPRPALPHVMREIGTAYTPFHKRNGTPRQGSLATHVRCKIVLHPDLQPQSVQHLQQYSHLWLLFRFHKNTMSSKESRRFDPVPAEAAAGEKPPQRRRVTDFFGNQRIAVPGMAGDTTGMLACRSPHHPNNIGMSLVQLHAVSVEKLPAPWYRGVQKGGTVRCVVLQVSGVDLVDCTPIYDIKPFVHLSDAPVTPLAAGADSNVSEVSAEPAPSGSAHVRAVFRARVPAWIKAGEERRLAVYFSAQAEAALLTRAGSKASLYTGSHSELQAALTEVLSLDIRTLHQGRYKHASAEDEALELLFDGLRVVFSIEGDTPEQLRVLVSGICACEAQ